ncbi:MAG: PPC domain-containing DNA-binding protein [Desulfomonilaceae bacterium]
MEERFVERLPKGGDLLEEIANVFQQRSISKATFNLIGAVPRAVLSYWDQDAQDFRIQRFDRHMEIVSCMGNVSMKDGEIAIHCHIVFAGTDYVCVGGHLEPGTEIYVGEIYVMPLPGEGPERVFDESTGLHLWPQGKAF